MNNEFDLEYHDLGLIEETRRNVLEETLLEVEALGTREEIIVLLREKFESAAEECKPWWLRKNAKV